MFTKSWSVKLFALASVSAVFFSAQSQNLVIKGPGTVVSNRSVQAPAFAGDGSALTNVSGSSTGTPYSVEWNYNFAENEYSSNNNNFSIPSSKMFLITHVSIFGIMGRGSNQNMLIEVYAWDRQLNRLVSQYYTVKEGADFVGNGIKTYLTFDQPTHLYAYSNTQTNLGILLNRYPYSGTAFCKVLLRGYLVDVQSVNQSDVQTEPSRGAQNETETGDVR